MDTATRVQVLDEVVCISHNSNTHGKGINLPILPSAMGKQQSRLGSLILVWRLVKERENSEFKSVKPRLKIVLISNSFRGGGIG